MPTQTEQIFFQILEANKAKIFRICQVYAQAPIEPHDLFQEIVYQIWKSFSTFENRSSIDTWIYKIALNVCLRSKMKFEKINEKTVKLEAIHFEPTQTQCSEDQKHKIQALHSCIATLNDTDKPLVVLYLEQLSYKAIAEITGLTENHIAVKMKRIRKKLFDCITHKLN